MKHIAESGRTRVSANTKSSRIPNTGSGFRPAARVAGIGVSEILAIGVRARALMAAGQDIVLMGAGEPDFATPDAVKLAAHRAIDNDQTSYTPLIGEPNLIEAIRSKFSRDNAISYTPSEITAAAGAKQVIFNALLASLDSGDEVIVPAPYWSSYVDMVSVAGGVPVVVPCAERDGFRLTPQALDAALTSRTRWLLLNSPSNPTGTIYSTEDFRGIGEVLARHPQVWVISDEIYEHLTYDQRPHVSLISAMPLLKERTLVVNGVSKSHAMTGWRLGYGAGPEELISAMTVIQSQSTSAPSSISQAAAVEALIEVDPCLAERREVYEHRRNLVIDYLNEIEGLSCASPAGAFYAFVGCGGVLGKRTAYGESIKSDMDFCRYALEAHGVAVIPGAAFGMSPYFRLSFAASESQLRVGMERLQNAIAELSF